MPNTNKERHLTGNRVLLRLDAPQGQDRILGAGVVGAVDPVQDVGLNSDFGLMDVRGLGNADALEYVVGATRFSVTINNLLLEEADAGYDPREIVLNEPITINIVSKKTGKVIESYIKALCGTRNVSVPANRLLTQALTFMAIQAVKMDVQ
jgi:hypothetical protein